MKRLLLAAVLLGSFALTWGPAARGQDAIHYFDRKTKKDEVARGTITEETPAEVSYKPAGGGPAASIRSADISEVEYQYRDNEKFARLQWTRPTNALRRARAATKPADRKKDLETALEAFQE